MDFLKNHLFPVEAFFDSSIVLTFAVPKEEILHLVKPHLILETYQDKWAFIAIAMVQTSHLRPKGFPKFMGNDFFLTGYRIFVRYTNTKGKKLRGLQIIKSETDKKKMEYIGNLFTHYSYTTTDINLSKTSNTKKIFSTKSNFEFSIDTSITDAHLPSSSPFSNWKDARKFSGPLPYTFTYNRTKNTMLIIKGVRQNWKPTPIHIKNYSFEFLENLSLKGLVLANAFEINNVPYYWEKGKIESCQ